MTEKEKRDLIDGLWVIFTSFVFVIYSFRVLLGPGTLSDFFIILLSCELGMRILEDHQ